MGCLCEQLAGEGVDLSSTCIGHLWLFANLRPLEIQAVTGAAQRRSFDRGEPIFMQGDPCGAISLIKAGRVKLSKLSQDGSETTLDIRKAGDFLGENMLSEEVDYPVSAWCMERVLICSFTKEGFEELVLEHPNIGLQVIKNLSRRITWLTDRIGSMSSSNLEDRLHRVLMNVAREHGIKSPTGFTIQFPLSHEDLSFLTGAHRVSITRAMKSLREAGKIIQRGRQLTLTFETEWV
ncbi:MAG: Crp/Fnr family transcriptional regulator [Syntrophobacteraceae bacterium]